MAFDFFPFYNSVRIASLATAITVFLGLAAAYYAERLPRPAREALDVILTLPLVLPPTVIGFFLLKILGPRGPVGALAAQFFQARLVMNWTAAVFASLVVALPLMYRTARGAFQSFDPDLKRAGRTLGLSDSYIFWRITLPCCKHGLIAGAILSFARALGEYGATSMIAGYIPGRTATISTTVYQLWRLDREAEAYQWVALNVALSAAVIIALNYFENRADRRSGRGRAS